MIRIGLNSWTWARAAARQALRGRFSQRGKDEQSEEEARDRERRARPELSAFDRANYEEIKKQIRDTSQPFVVQPREEQLRQMQERSTKLHLRQFELVKNEEHFKEDASVSRPKGVMDFFDPRLSLKPGTRG